MVALDFLIDESELSEAASGNFDDGVLLHTCLLMPIRFAVDGHELLRSPDSASDRIPGPLLNWATIGVSLIESLPNHRRAIYSVPGTGNSLRFVVAGDHVWIASSLNGQSGCASLTDLIAAARHFRASVRELLVTRLPAIGARPHWSNTLNQPHQARRVGRFGRIRLRLPGWLR